MVHGKATSDGVWVFDARDAMETTRLRREIVGFLRRNARRIDDAASELILGELLGNIVKHTPGFAEVAVACRGGESRLLVTDRGAGYTGSGAHALPANPFSENGRGMFLVHALSRSVAIKSSVGGGTQIAVDLPLRTAVVPDVMSA